MSIRSRLAGMLVVSIALCVSGVTLAQGTRSKSKTTRPPTANENVLRERINQWTIGLAGGLLEGAPIRLATEVARVVNDGENLHVLPIVTRGPTENVNDLLYLKGVDTAIISTDSLEEYKSQVPDIQQRIHYILNLFPSELHIFVRPEIKTLADLAGKKVNFNTQGTAAAFTGPLIFSRLGINVDKMFIPHPQAIEQMKRSSDISAVVFITSKPVDAFTKGKWDPGFKFLPVAYDSRFEDYYLPTTLESSDYPNLLEKGQRIDTIAVPTVLTVYNWRNADRYRRVARFVDRLFSRIDKLQAPGFDPKWKDINLNAKVPGLERFRAAQEWLDANTARVRDAAVKRILNVAMALFAVGGAAYGQQSGDAIARFKSCLQRDGAARPECLDALSRQLSGTSPSAAIPPNGGHWVVSETTSPLDYSAQITASILAEAPAKDAPSLLSIRCRGEKTELLVSTSGTWRPSRGQFRVLYRIDDQRPIEGRWVALASGRSAAFSGDVVALLRALPEGGRVSISVFDMQGATHDGTFHIIGMDSVREKIAAACKW